MHGINPVGKGSDRVLALRSAQKNVCNRTEFQSNTKFVPTSPYAVLNGATYNGIHHYYGRADTYYDIGQAFGEAMATLLVQSKYLALVENWNSIIAKVSSDVLKRMHFLFAHRS
jgi:hypothetical protein